MAVKNIIQVAPDSTGKKLDTRELTGQGGSGTDTVQRQVIGIGSADFDYYAGVNLFGLLSTSVEGAVNLRDYWNTSRNAWVSEHGRLRVGMDTMFFYDPFDGTNLNYNLWASANTTMVGAQASGFFTLNSGAITTLATTFRIESQKDFVNMGEFPLRTQFKAKTNITPIANATMEIGFLLATGTAAPTEGCFFRWSPSGVFQCVVNAGGTEVTANVTAPTANTVHLFEILVQNRQAYFIIDAGTPQTVNFGNTAPSAWTVQSCPFGARVYTGAGAPATAPQLSISEVNVSLVDLQAGRDYAEQGSVGMGRSAYQKPVFATDWGQTAAWSNTAQASTTALTNTTAPNGWQANLGGDFAIQQPGSSATDLLVFGYQVPAQRTLIVRRINISPIVVTNLAAGAGAVQLFWAAGFGASALSLATAESPPGSWGPRRMPLGIQALPATAAIGTVSTPGVAIDMDLSGGVGVVESSRYLHIIVKILGGTATATSFWRGTCTIIGTFE